MVNEVGAMVRIKELTCRGPRPLLTCPEAHRSLACRSAARLLGRLYGGHSALLCPRRTFLLHSQWRKWFLRNSRLGRKWMWSASSQGIRAQAVETGKASGTDDREQFLIQIIHKGSNSLPCLSCPACWAVLSNLRSIWHTVKHGLSLQHVLPRL